MIYKNIIQFMCYKQNKDFTYLNNAIRRGNLIQVVEFCKNVAIPYVKHNTELSEYAELFSTFTNDMYTSMYFQYGTPQEKAIILRDSMILCGDMLYTLLDKYLDILCIETERLDKKLMKKELFCKFLNLRCDIASDVITFKN